MADAAVTVEGESSAVLETPAAAATSTTVEPVIVDTPITPPEAKRRSNRTVNEESISAFDEKVLHNDEKLTNIQMKVWEKKLENEVKKGQLLDKTWAGYIKCYV